MRSVLDQGNKGNVEIKQMFFFFGFPKHIKVMFMLYCNLLSMQEHTHNTMSKNNVHTLI